MTNTLAQKIKNIFNEIDKISHPLTRTISISEVEEEISRYKDHTLISIDVQDNTTEAWESKDRSDFQHHETATLDMIKGGKSAELTRIIEDLRIPKSTLVTFIPKESEKRNQRINSLFRELEEMSPLNIAFNTTPTQTRTDIRIEDPIISILADFKRMCNNIHEEMLAQIQLGRHPKTEERAIRNAASRMYTEWERGGGYREAISNVRGAKNKNSIKCSLIGDTLKELRETADKTRRTPAINRIKDFVRKAQELTPKDIIVTDTNPTSTKT